MITHLASGASGAPLGAQQDSPPRLKPQGAVRKCACVEAKDLSQVKCLVVSLKLTKTANISFYFN